jgi:hypothetical protein
MAIFRFKFVGGETISLLFSQLRLAARQVLITATNELSGTLSLAQTAM